MDDYIDHYEVLGLSATATIREIDRAYREKIKATHPDKNSGCSQAEELTKRLNLARDLLKDPARRQAFDQQRCQRQRREAKRRRPSSSRRRSSERRSSSANDTRWTPPPPPQWTRPVHTQPAVDPVVAGLGFLAVTLLVIGGAALLSNKSR